MTITVDEGWPVVQFSYDGPLTAADVETFQEVLQRGLRREQRFAVVVARQPDGPPADRGLAKSQMQFLQAHHDELARWHAGMAYVQSAEQPPGRARVADLTPYPVQGFDSLAAAQQWATQQATTS